jgi:TolB-like protein
MFKKLLVLTFVCLLGGVSYGQQPAPKKYLAVMDLEGHGVPQTDLEVLTIHLRKEFSKMPQFVVIQENDIIDRLKTAGMLDANCHSDDCASNVGKALNAQLIVTGSVGKLGYTYTVDIRMIDIETSKIIGVATKNYKGILSGLASSSNEMTNNLVATSHN